MIGAGEFRAGMKVEIDGEPYLIVDAVHVKPAKGGAFVRTKFRNLRTGNQLERTHRVVEKFDEPDIEERRLQFLYQQGEDFHFMDSQSYDQLSLTARQLGDSRKFLKEHMEAVVMFYKGKPIGVTLPNFVELVVSDTDPGGRGDTATGGTKPATMETGAVIKVPFHINVGDLLKIDTRSGEYVERMKSA
ncbi:MAG: elongation factor P [Nitrospirae bacterium]|nr:elongation factor P [Nitrospirota bacterium]